MTQQPQYQHIDDLPDFCTLGELVQVLPISKASIYRVAERGQFPCIRIGRRIIISRESVKAWLEMNMEVNGYAKKV